MSTRKKTKASPSGRGSVILIASLLLGSAILRIVTSAGAAVAEGNLANQLLLPKPSSTPETAAPEMDPKRISTLLDALTERENRVADQEVKIALKAKAVEVAQIEVERRLEALQQAEERLNATLARAQSAAEGDLAQLTTVYENMKPKDATALFEAMEPEFAAGFLARMRPDVAAKIMSGLDPNIAYSISAILAGRNAKAPKN